MQATCTLRLMAICLVMVPTMAMADFVGVFAGGGIWHTDLSGDVVSGVNTESELGLSGDSANYLYVALEHPVPILPNIRLARTSLQDSGQGTITSDFLFEGSAFIIGENVATDLDLTHTDVTLYYEILDTGADFDIGLTARSFNGKLRIDQVSEGIDGYLPMVYVAGRFALPFSGMYLGADVNALSYSSNTLADYSVRVGWETSSWIFPELGLEVGYRKLSLDLDESDADVDLDVSIDGAFINLVAHF